MNTPAEISVEPTDDGRYGVVLWLEDGEDFLLYEGTQEGAWDYVAMQQDVVIVPPRYESKPEAEPNPFDGNPGAWEQYILGVYEPHWAEPVNPPRLSLRAVPGKVLRALRAPWGHKWEALTDVVDEFWYTNRISPKSPLLVWTEWKRAILVAWMRYGIYVRPAYYRACWQLRSWPFAEFFHGDDDCPF